VVDQLELDRLFKQLKELVEEKYPRLVVVRIDHKIEVRPKSSLKEKTKS